MKLKKIKIALVIITMSLAQMSVSFAEDAGGDEAETAIVPETYNNCIEIMRPVLEKELIDFITFLDTTFRNKSSNSSLLNLAVGRYREYTNAIDAKFDSLKPQIYTESEEGTGEERKVQYRDQLEEYIDCSTLVSNEKTAAKELMIKKIKTSNYQKKAAIMLEKYQAVNFKIRELYFSIIKTYSYFSAFKNKLPFFIEKCQ